MKGVSPSDYAVIADNVTEIREGPQNYAWGGSRAILEKSKKGAAPFSTFEDKTCLQMSRKGQPLFRC